MAPLIRADVNAAANWAEALHNVMAAAAMLLLEFAGGPAEDRVARTHFQQPWNGVVFVLSFVCRRGSLTPEPRPRGGRSLVRPQPMKPMVEYQD